MTISRPKIYLKVYSEQETTIIDKTNRLSFPKIFFKIPL